MANSNFEKRERNGVEDNLNFGIMKDSIESSLIIDSMNVLRALIKISIKLIMIEVSVFL